MPGQTFPESEMMSAAGQLLRINQHVRLFAIIGLSFGGNGTSDFGLPVSIGYSPDPDLKYLITYNGDFPLTSEDALP
jgi:microcystin-dependent protein